MHKSNVATHLCPWLNYDLHAIDATPARLRGGVGLSLHPTHWLISTQVFSLGLVFYYVWERKLPSVKGALNVDDVSGELRGRRRCVGREEDYRLAINQGSPHLVLRGLPLQPRLCANQPVSRLREARDHTATPSSWRRVDGVEVMI